jgi:hypothetical protein
MAVDVLNSVAGLVTIPVLSALLAQGAVVFGQRQRSEQFLSLPDLFALADRGWTSMGVLWSSMNRPEKEDTGQTIKMAWYYLLPGAALILIGAIQQPLRQILVPTETIQVATCGDLAYMPGCANQSREWYANYYTPVNYATIGFDIEPAQMAGIYYQDILPRITSDLASLSVDEDQPYIWSDHVTAQMLKSLNSDERGDPRTGFANLGNWIFESATFPAPKDGNWDDSRFFVAGLPSNVTTGILREHAMRLNSSVACEKINQALFPSICPGEEPFTASFNVTGDINVQICVPGNLGVFPWSLTRNRQNITEEMYIDILDLGFYGEMGEMPDEEWNGTLRCEVETTRGYFELGSLRNNNTYGPLLETWPDADEMARDYNDFVSDLSSWNGFVPAER